MNRPLLRPDLHAARLLARPDLVSVLRELYMILLESHCSGERASFEKELVAAYVNDIATAAEYLQPVPPPSVRPDGTAAGGELAELRTLRDDVARLLGIGPNSDGHISRSWLLASLTRTIALAETTMLEDNRG